MELSRKNAAKNLRPVLAKEASSSTGRKSLRRRMVIRKSVRTKVRRLQRIVPGGKGLEPDVLFLRTANYILHLRLQVNMLQGLSKLYKP